MRNRIIFFLLISIICFRSNGQLNSELIDQVLKSRSSYVADSIPDIFRWHYELLTQAGSTMSFYDTLKNILSKTSFPADNFFWIEYLSDDHGSKRAMVYTNNFMVRFNRRFIAPWGRKTPSEDSIIYNLEIHDDYRESLVGEFAKDFEEWNEFVTNRSYAYWDGAGGSYIFCSKVMFKSDQVEILHTAFKSYHKNSPYFCLKEHPEDDYKARFQANCSWVKNERNEEVMWYLLGSYKERGCKVFDCDGNEVGFEYVE